MLQNLLGKSNILEKSINATLMRNDVISQNIANVDTPGYKRKDVSFEEILKDSIDKSNLEGRTTNERHIAINSRNIAINSRNIDKIQPKVTVENSDVSMRIDENNVDIDSEMASLAKNSIQYNTLIQLLNGGFTKIKNVIAEGRR